MRKHANVFPIFWLDAWVMVRALIPSNIDSNIRMRTDL